MAKGNFGERLKRERVMREVPLEEITAATRIGRRYLEALENEEWQKLPGGVFARGFVRTLARYLGLNEESLLGDYDLARKEDPGAAPAAPPQTARKALPLWIPAAALVLVLLGLAAGALYGWRYYAARRAAQTKSAEAAAAETELLELAVSTSAATRVRIVGDGAALLDAELAGGETRKFSARERFEVTVGDSSAVLLELNGQTMPPIGAPGASGTISLSRKDLRPASRGSDQP